MRTGIDAIRDQIERVTPSWLWDQMETARERIPLLRQERERTGERFTIVCGCGTPTFAWYDEAGVYHIESHADGVMGSDVPCYGSWY